MKRIHGEARDVLYAIAMAEAVYEQASPLGRKRFERAAKRGADAALLWACVGGHKVTSREVRNCDALVMR